MMTLAQQRRLVELLNEVKEYIQGEPEFIEDAELRAVYTILMSAEAGVMFGDTVPLAQVCADWCEDRAKTQIESG
jgi:hypothetical protein